MTVPAGRQLRADEVKRYVAKTFRLSRNSVIRVIDPTQPERLFEGQASATCVITHRSLDARGKAVLRYKVEVYGGDESYVPYKLPEYKDVHEAEPVIVVGAGPAGMFAALKLLFIVLNISLNLCRILRRSSVFCPFCPCGHIIKTL